MTRERLAAVLVPLGALATALLWIGLVIAYVTAAAVNPSCETPTETGAIHVVIGSLYAAVPLNFAGYVLARGGLDRRLQRVGGLALLLSALGLVGLYVAAFFTACWE